MLVSDRGVFRQLGYGDDRDARGMLWTALEDPDPVIIFRAPDSLQRGRELPPDAGPVDIDSASVRRAGRDAIVIAYGCTFAKALEAASTLSAEGIEVEVVDRSTLRPLDMTTVLSAVRRTRRAVGADEETIAGRPAVSPLPQARELHSWNLAQWISSKAEGFIAPARCLTRDRHFDP